MPLYAGISSRVFLSYHNAERQLAETAAAGLRAVGLEVVAIFEDLGKGRAGLRRALRRAVTDECKTPLLLNPASGGQSPWVSFEIVEALLSGLLLIVWDQGNAEVQLPIDLEPQEASRLRGRSVPWAVFTIPIRRVGIPKAALGTKAILDTLSAQEQVQELPALALASPWRLEPLFRGGVVGLEFLSVSGEVPRIVRVQRRRRRIVLAAAGVWGFLIPLMFHFAGLVPGVVLAIGGGLALRALLGPRRAQGELKYLVAALESAAKAMRPASGV